MVIKPLDETLQDLLKEASGKPLKLQRVVTALRGRGIPAFLILLSLPFCLPIQIPGFSFFFGIVLALLGLRLAFSQKMWWPKRLLEKELSYQTLEHLSRATTKWVNRAKKFVRPRLIVISQNPLLRRLHGCFVILMALLLALPLPIPLTNLLSAFPIFFMGLGLLEDDGYMILISYLLGLFALFFWFSLFFLGEAGFQKIFSQVKVF